MRSLPRRADLNLLGQVTRFTGFDLVSISELNLVHTATRTLFDTRHRKNGPKHEMLLKHLMSADRSLPKDQANVKAQAFRKQPFLYISFLQVASLSTTDAAIDSSQATYEGTGLVFKGDGTVGGGRIMPYKSCMADMTPMYCLANSAMQSVTVETSLVFHDAHSLGFKTSDYFVNQMSGSCQDC